MTATDVNHILGKLYTAVAQNRVLTSVGGAKSEFKFSYKFEQWKEMSRNATPLSPPRSIQAPPTGGPDAKAPIGVAANHEEESPTNSVSDPPVQPFTTRDSKP